jgi:NADPH2:quinone reductase
MKALRCKQYGPPESLVFEDIASPPLGAGDVRIAVRACGVNFPDLLIIKGEYQVKPPLPFTPGAEVSGDIVEVGPGVSRLGVGDRVMTMTAWNGYAEEVVAAAEQCFRMPTRMDYDVAAGFSMTYGTSYHALVQRGRLAPGETLLVLGAAGGVGTAALEIGRILGAEIIAAAGSDEKLEAVRRAYGVQHAINYRTSSLKDEVRKLTNGRGADVIYDAVGGDLFEQSLRSINWDGRLLVVGFAGGIIPQARANLILLKGCAVVGVFWGAFAAREPQRNKENFEQLLQWYEEGRLTPQISHRFPLEKAAEALHAVMERKVIGKSVLIVGNR